MGSVDAPNSAMDVNIDNIGGGGRNSSVDKGIFKLLFIRIRSAYILVNFEAALNFTVLFYNIFAKGFLS
jgi:hypothetical protein